MPTNPNSFLVTATGFDPSKQEQNNRRSPERHAEPINRGERSHRGLDKCPDPSADPFRFLPLRILM